MDDKLLSEAKTFYDKKREDNYWFDYLAKTERTETFVLGAMTDFAESLSDKDNGLSTSIKEMLCLFGFKHKDGDTYTCLNIDVKIRNEKEIKPAFENFLAKVNNRGYNSAKDKFKEY